MPKGLTPFLRSASVSEDEDGSLRISGLAGPAAERLGESATLQEIREGLAPHVGHLPNLLVDGRPESPDSTRRVTEAEVRQDTLQALLRQEPRLQRAVEELDLELMD